MDATPEEKKKIAARIPEVVRRLRAEHAKLQSAIRSEQWADVVEASVEIGKCASFLKQFSHPDEQSHTA